MNAEQLWDTTLNPDTRRLLPVAAWRADGTVAAAGERLLTKLMGKGEAASRRALMELHGDAVVIDVLSPPGEALRPASLRPAGQSARR